MVKLIIGLLVLLAICAAVGIVRKIRGGTFLPPPIDGEEPPPRNLEEMHRRRKK
jgi:hypothetical protein